MYQPSPQDGQNAAIRTQEVAKNRRATSRKASGPSRRRHATAFRGMVFGALICTPFWVLVAYLLLR